MGKYLRISSYIRKPFLIYDFATAPLWISLYMRKIWFSFLSVHCILFWVMPHPDMPADRLLTHAEVTAKLAPVLFKASHVCVGCGGTIPPLTFLYTPPLQGPSPPARPSSLSHGDRRPCQEPVSVDRLQPHLGLTGSAGPWSSLWHPAEFFKFREIFARQDASPI